MISKSKESFTTKKLQITKKQKHKFSITFPTSLHQRMMDRCGDDCDDDEENMNYQ